MPAWEDRNQAAIDDAQTGNLKRNWYVLRVDSQRIGRAIDLLPQIGVAAFAPVEQRTRRAGRGKRSSITRAQPIMSGYVIAGFIGQPNWYCLLQMPFIYSIVARDGRPFPIPAESLERCFGIHQAAPRSLPGSKSLSPGDTIRVTAGCFQGHEAKLIDIKDGDCEFIVQLFGRDARWRQPLHDVEAA